MDNDFLVPGKEGNDTSCREIDCEIVNDDKTIIECETQVDNEANDGSYLILLKLTRRIVFAENEYSFDVIAKVMPINSYVTIFPRLWMNISLM